MCCRERTESSGGLKKQALGLAPRKWLPEAIPRSGRPRPPQPPALEPHSTTARVGSRLRRHPRLQVGVPPPPRSPQDSGLVTFPKRSHVRDPGHVWTLRCRATEECCLTFSRACHGAWDGPVGCAWAGNGHVGSCPSHCVSDGGVYLVHCTQGSGSVTEAVLERG